MYIPAWPSLNPLDLVRRPFSRDPPFPLDRPQAHYFYVARNGIYQLFRQLDLSDSDVVLVPDYHHGNEIFAIESAGVHLRYYPVKRNLELDMDAVAGLCDRHTRVLYITHFIGWPQPMDAIRQFCRERNLLLVEDCALSLFSRYGDAPLGSFGDYAIFCLYKSLPLPNGGLLLKNPGGQGPDLAPMPIRQPGGLSVAARTSELVLQWIRYRHERTGRLLFDVKRRAGRALSAARVERSPVGDTGFSRDDADLGMSKLSRRLLKRFDCSQIHHRRRENYLFLAEQLSDSARCVREDLPEGVCPLFFPLLVRDKAAAARQLWQHGIETVEFWNEGNTGPAATGSAAAWLRGHVLEVPIHQEIGLEQLQFMATHIRNLGADSLLQ